MRWLERLLRYRRRSLIFTSLGTRFVLVTLAVGLAAINTGNNLLYLVLALLLSLITLSGILSEQCLRHLDVVRRLPSTIFASGPTPVTVAVVNRKRLFPSFLLHLCEADGDGRPASAVEGANPPIFVLPPDVARSVTYRLTFGRRGLYHLGGVVASTRFPFGLFTKRLFLPLPQEVVVYPALLPNEALTGLVNPLGQEPARARRGQGGGFFVLRDYIEGDDARMIHWKSSARQAKLLVKETEEEEHREVTLRLDRRWPSDAATARETALYAARFERAISLAATLAVEWGRRGWRMGLHTDGVALAPGQGRVHLAHLLRALALLPPLGTHEPSQAGGIELSAADGEQGFSIALLIWEKAAGSRPSGATDYRRLVTCPNEPSGDAPGEE